MLVGTDEHHERTQGILMNQAITHLIFDLGGVIIELRGTPILSEWTGSKQSAEQLWEKWLTSEAPRAFESGKIDKDAFAASIVEELSLSISSDEFLEYFTNLPIGPYKGSLKMLHSLRPRYTTALFSNSNAAHWARKSAMQVPPAFDHHFASHLMGKVKPDSEAFEHVVAELGVPASNMLFFDDNEINVQAARHAGMNARRVVGYDQLLTALDDIGIYS